MNSATIVKTDGTRAKLDHRPTLLEAQNVVGGYIELVRAKSSRTGKTATLVVNEDGRPQHLQVNSSVTTEYGPSVSGGCIVGNVIVLEGWQTVGN